MLIISLILASKLQELPTCNQKFREFERKFDMWSRARRAIDDNGEEHKFHRVEPSGNTITIVIKDVPESQVRHDSLYGFEPRGFCVRDNVVKTIMIKVTERK